MLQGDVTIGIELFSHGFDPIQGLEGFDKENQTV